MCCEYWLAVGPQSLYMYKEDHLQILKCVFFFILRLLWLVGRFGTRKPFLKTHLTVFIPTNRPKLVRNRCVIDVFDGVFIGIHNDFRNEPLMFAIWKYVSSVIRTHTTPVHNRKVTALDRSATRAWRWSVV